MLMRTVLLIDKCGKYILRDLFLNNFDLTHISNSKHIVGYGHGSKIRCSLCPLDFLMLQRNQHVCLQESVKTQK